jgi:hypothetical protein
MVLLARSLPTRPLKTAEIPVQVAQEDLVMQLRILVALRVGLCLVLLAVGQFEKTAGSIALTHRPTSGATYEGVKWQKGPSVGQLGVNAQVKVPDGYLFAGALDTRTIMEANRNPITNRELDLSPLPVRIGLLCLNLTTSVT